MKLLFLGKRRPMGRDLMTRPYGRFHHLPATLSQCGHEVTSLLLDYRGGASIDSHSDGMRRCSEPLIGGGNGGYLKVLDRLVRAWRPDWIIGCSDTWFGILARYFATRYGCRSCIDAYDNYESYMQWNRPLHLLWRRALARADLVSAAGPGLLELMSAARGGKPGIIVPMAADPEFTPRGQAACRRRMDLPDAVPLIGYCGSLFRNRGIDVLFDAFARLRESRPDVELVLSGRRGRGVRLPEHARWLGYVDDELMPVLLCSLDVLAVINRDSKFGNYSYPVKLYEAIGCGVPVVATRTPATEWILQGRAGCLVSPGDSDGLCDTLLAGLRGDACKSGAATDWRTGGLVLERALLEG